MAEARSRTAAQRAEFRAWVRRHHPDAGGDPDEFAAGLRRYRAARRRRAGSAVVVVKRRRWPISLLYRWRERRLRARDLR
ncbi:MULTISPECIES: hypothetical protein [Thermomonosporaceae]|uniref:hypothetical protein n=1 Tax=Thermomonosporaceae TaxID=2012 RepID=UPI00255AD5AD|nr:MULTISPECIES: hypothetical protein [Thermomonosporaceae]MDL4775637.1 hypothetical protein [Actinomadura xylanilytica]